MKQARFANQSVRPRPARPRDLPAAVAEIETETPEDTLFSESEA